MKKKTKKFLKNTLGSGIGLMTGSIISDKIDSGYPSAAPVNKNVQSAISLGSVGIAVGGAKYAMDSVDMLYKEKKKRRK